MSSDMKPGPELDDLIDIEVMGSEGLCGQVVPKYSTDIKAAWEVVQKLESDGWFLSMFRHAAYNVTLGSDELKSGYKVGLSRQMVLNEVVVDAETAELGICLAALKAVNHD